MSTQRKYADEVLADALAGVVPNASVAERACAQVDALRALNAELLAALHDMVHYDDLPEAEQAPAMAKARAAIAKAQEGKS